MPSHPISESPQTNLLELPIILQGRTVMAGPDREIEAFSVRPPMSGAFKATKEKAFEHCRLNETRPIIGN
jgi:hypothetical protein